MSECWEVLSVKFCQLLHGGVMGFGSGPCRERHRRALETIRCRVASILSMDNNHEVWERNVCVWRRSEETRTFRGQPVRNGMFGVAKPGKFVQQKPVLGVIVILIPSNSLFRPLAGAVHKLPLSCQWSTSMLGADEQVEVCQADITSAFY